MVRQNGREQRDLMENKDMNSRERKAGLQVGVGARVGETLELHGA